MELTFDTLTKRYGRKEALRGVSFTLTDGIYGLLGPNGAGKSTLMNILTGNLPATSGRILLDGRDTTEMGQAFRKRLGYMPQQQTLYPGFSVERFLYYIASLRGMEKEHTAQRVRWALDAVSLWDVRRSPVRSLSGGMKQRLLLAQAVLDDPDILVLDEPTAGLDPRQRIAVRNLISQISFQKIVIISTHVVPDIEYVVKEVLLLSEGQILQKDTEDRLTAQLQGRVWEVRVPQEQVSEARAWGQVCGLAKKEGQVLLRLLSQERPPVSDAQTVPPSLEDVYLWHFGEEGMA